MQYSSHIVVMVFLMSFSCFYVLLAVFMHCVLSVLCVIALVLLMLPRIALFRLPFVNELLILYKIKNSLYCTFTEKYQCFWRVCVWCVTTQLSGHAFMQVSSFFILPACSWFFLQYLWYTVLNEYSTAHNIMVIMLVALNRFSEYSSNKYDVECVLSIYVTSMQIHSCVFKVLAFFLQCVCQKVNQT